MQEIKFKGSEKFRAIAQIANALDGLDSEKEYVLTVKEYKAKRSLNANSYAWLMLDKLAEQLHIGKTELYRTYIKDVGGNSEIICIQDKALDRFCERWEQGHIGRFTETIPSKIDGCTNVIVYYGSSDFDTASMSRLIDLIVQDCKEQGIPTLEDIELQRLCDEWECENGEQT